MGSVLIRSEAIVMPAWPIFEGWNLVHASDNEEGSLRPC